MSTTTNLCGQPDGCVSDPGAGPAPDFEREHDLATEAAMKRAARVAELDLRSVDCETVEAPGGYEQTISLRIVRKLSHDDFADWDAALNSFGATLGLFGVKVE